MIAIDTVMIGVIMHADGAVNGCVDTLLTGCRGHISSTVSGGSSGYAQASFRFDYSDARLMGVTSLPLHNLGERGWAVIVLPGRRSPGGKSSSGCTVAYRLAAVSSPHLFASSCQRGNITVCKLAGRAFKAPRCLCPPTLLD